MKSIPEPSENLEPFETTYDTYNAHSSSGGGSIWRERLRAVACDPRTWLVGGAALLFLVAFGFGFLAGFLARGSGNSAPREPDNIVQPLEPQMVLYSV